MRRKNFTNRLSGYLFFKLCPNFSCQFKKIFKILLSFQLCEGLTFLHDSAKLLHRNLSPDSIVLNEAGAWKIFGFDFCLTNQSTGGLISKSFSFGSNLLKKVPNHCPFQLNRRCSGQCTVMCFQQF